MRSALARLAREREVSGLERWLGLINAAALLLLLLARAPLDSLSLSFCLRARVLRFSVNFTLLRAGDLCVYL